MVNTIISGIIGVALTIGGLLGITQPTHPIQQAPQPVFGAYSPSGGGTYRLGQSVGIPDSSFKLSSFKEPVSNIPYTMSYLGSSVAYGTISPQTTVSEFVSFTGITQNSDGSALLTGVTRGLSRTPAASNCVASTTLAQPHAGQSIFILSDSPCHFAEYAVKRNNESITGIYTFASTSKPKYDGSPTFSGSDGLALVNYATLLSTAIQGAATSTETNMGIVQLANATQIGSSTASSTEGRPLVILNKFATTTPGVLCNTWSCVVAGVSGKIKQTWLNLTESFTYSGGLNSTATTTLAGSSVNGNAVVINTVPYQFPSTVCSSGQVWINNGSGVWSCSSISNTKYSLVTTTDIVAANGFATSTPLNIPASVMTASSTITVTANGSCVSTGSATCTFHVRNAAGVDMATESSSPASGQTWRMNLTFNIFANNSTSAQTYTSQNTSMDTGTISAIVAGNVNNSEGTSAINTASALSIYGVIEANNAATYTLSNMTITVNP